MRVGMSSMAAGAALLCCLPAAALAQTEGPGGRTVYEAAYFAQFSPGNALELVQRVPGFTLELGSQDVRGFGQAAGNVVINGSRPSSKSDTLETILARIPANRVARVEVGPGDLFGSEFSGKPQVLNLVTTSTGGLAGTLNATLRRDFSGQITPEGSVSVLYRRGKSSFNASAGYNNAHFPEEGPDFVTRPDGSLIERREKYNDTSDHEAYVSGSWELSGGDNEGAHLNFRAARGRLTLYQDNNVFPTVGPVRDDTLTQDYRRRDYELGGDVTRPLFGGGIKLIGLATRRHRLNHDDNFNRVQSQVIGGFVQDVDNQRNETVARLVWNRTFKSGWSVETGAEGALNSLDSDVNFSSVNAGGVRTRIDLPVDQAKVTEYRGEAFANAGRAIGKGLRMDLGLTYEASRLTVSGDATAERTLRFLKPRGVLDWKPDGGWHFQLSLGRTVAQLNFDDFISTAELTNDRVDAGNADLVPQRAWETRFTAEHPILGDGLAKLELGWDRISLVQDRIPTPEGFDAPGNLGDGRLLFGRATLDVPLASLGIKGARFTFNGVLRDTSVQDPYTLRNRRFTGYTDWGLETGLRQDLGKFAWGLNFYSGAAVSFFRRNEIDTSDGTEPYLAVFAEYRPTQKTTVTLGADNIANVPGVRRRVFFFPDRSNTTPGQYELRSRNGHVSLYVRLKQSFG